MDDITLANLAEHLKRLTVLNGPRGSMSDWIELTSRLQEVLRQCGLALDYDDENSRYVVCIVSESVSEGE